MIDRNTDFVGIQELISFGILSLRKTDKEQLITNLA